MAPILSTATGIPTIEYKSDLFLLWKGLSERTDRDSIREILEKHGKDSNAFWEEQVDLHQWIAPLNHLDLFLVQDLRNYPLLLIPPCPETKVVAKSATSVEDVMSVPVDVWEMLSLILKFYTNLLLNATSKTLFGSMQEVMELLSAIRDDIASLALQVIQSCSMPSPSRSPPDSTNASVTLSGGGRLVAIAITKPFVSASRDLLTLPLEEGSQPADVTPTLVNFAYHEEETEKVSFLELIESDFLDVSESTTNNLSKKRRRAESPTPGFLQRYKSTAEVFLLAIQRASPSLLISAQFPFLCHVRSTRMELHDIAISRSTGTWVSNSNTLAKLRATLALLNTASVETMSLFTSSQSSPEWIGYIMQILKDVVSDLTEGGLSHLGQDGIAALSDDSSPPSFEHKLLAIQCLTALVSRRDSNRGSNVMQDLGIGKSQTFGVLPLLLRYSLAAIVGTVTTSSSNGDLPIGPPHEDTIDIGIAFLEGSVISPETSHGRDVQVARALELTEAILTLTTSVPSSPSGIGSLVDAGLIPSLLTVISTRDVLQRLDCPPTALLMANVQYITAEAVQILEWAIVSHNQAMAVFLELDGVKVLTTRMTQDVEEIEKAGMITPAQRFLLFCVVTSLTIICHQETTNLAGPIIRQPDFASKIVQMLDHVSTYGARIASLLSTLLSDVMNSDPHIVHYVHQSGIGRALLDLIGKGTSVELLAVQELIQVIPTVLAALALTTDGAALVATRNPFPMLFQVFYHPQYAMPQSRCLLSEMTSIVGTGLDQICRHVDRLKPLVLQAAAEAVSKIVEEAEDLGRRETESFVTTPELDTERTHLIQFVLNLTQMLEQILHTEEHCIPFVDAGGLDALFRLFPASMIDGGQFLAYISCLSAPTMSTLHHATVEDSLLNLFKCLQFRYNQAIMIRRVLLDAAYHADALDTARIALFGDADWSLDVLPRIPVYKHDAQKKLKAIASFLRQVSISQWSVNLLTVSIKTAVQRSQEIGTGWSPSERDWKREITKQESIILLERISQFQHKAILEVCRCRTELGFEHDEEQRYSVGDSLRFRLRIVCPEGAVVRDGVEIDSCANVGSMEFGEVVEAFDRCINSSGIMRYRTDRGWVSEMTRGHGREPISEVISVYLSDDTIKSQARGERIDVSVPSLRSVGIGVLARGQASLSDLYCALSRLSMLSVRAIPSRSVTFEPDTVGGHVARMIRFLTASLVEPMNDKHFALPDPSIASCRHDGLAMYYSCLLNMLHACLFEQSERGAPNLPLLLAIISSDPIAHGLTANDNTYDSNLENVQIMGVLGACAFIFRVCAAHFNQRPDSVRGVASKPKQRVARFVAASLPPTISFLRRLVSYPLSTSSISSTLSRFRLQDLPPLLGNKDLGLAFTSSPAAGCFETERFVSGLQVAVSRLVKIAWLRPYFVKAPPHLLYPMVCLIGDLIVGFENSYKKKPSNTLSGGNGFNLSDYFRRRRQETDTEEEEEYLVDDSAVSRLVEMGFDRDRALDAFESTRTSRVDVAMEYALSHAPPSPTTIQRRQAERAQRLNRNVDSQSQPSQQTIEDSIHETNESASTTVDETIALETASNAQCASETVNIISAKVELDSWLELAPIICSNILSSVGKIDIRFTSENDVNGLGETEAVTMILSSFLLDLCHSYPDKRKSMVTVLLKAFKDSLTSGETDLSCLLNVIPTSSEYSVVALCHASVLVIRALPKTRRLVLEENLVGYVVAAISTVLKSLDAEIATTASVIFPSFLTPALLFLNIMAQPVVEFNSDELSTEVGAAAYDKEQEELSMVKGEHRSQAQALSDLSIQLFPAIAGITATKKEHNPLQTIPPCFPLMPQCYEDHLRSLCVRILQTHEKKSAPDPGLAHATLLLLLRLLRSPQTAPDFRRIGIADSILKLPKESRFNGNTGVVSSIFRRLLEDESTLQNSMEIEMRTTISRLQLKKASNVGTDKPQIALHEFMESVTRLLYRDAHSFLKALCFSVMFETKMSDVCVSPLSSDQRSKRLALLADAGTDSTGMNNTRHEENARRQHRSPAMLKIRSKVPQKNSPQKKRMSVSKHTKSCPKESSQVESESAATHLISLLINAIVTSSASDPSPVNDSFLWTGSLLEVLCELVLAVPSCASAVHNYKPHRIKEKSARLVITSNLKHGLFGCPSPTKSFVNYVLHTLLPQDRWGLLSDHQVWERRKWGNDDESSKIKKKRENAYRVIKVSQSSARFILALASRPGEGRRRVIADLVYAVSGGQLGHGSILPSTSVKVCGGDISARSTIEEQSALLAWAELCLGIIAPRSTVKTVDGVANLNAEYVRICLDVGMVHALLFALHRVELCHAMAATTCGALLMPLECLTRGSVSEAIRKLTERDKEKGAKSAAVHPSLDVSSMEEDVIDVRRDGNEFELADSENHEMEEDNQSSDTSENDDMNSDSTSDDESESSEIEDSDESMDEESQHSGEESYSTASEDEEVDDEGEWNGEDGDGFAVDAENMNGFFDDLNEYEGATELVEQAIEDGWHRIETSAFGRVSAVNRTSAMERARSHGFVDATTGAMFNTMLQNGALSADFIQQLQGTLEGTIGARLMNSVNQATQGENPFAARLLSEPPAPATDQGRRNEGISTLPLIQQQIQPEIGSSVFSARFAEVSSMELIYGGPSATGCSRNYYLISSVERWQEDEHSPHLTQLDLQLFPGGPGAGNGSQYPLHPLLCGVDLPPANALFTNLLPHNVRATRPVPTSTRHFSAASNTHGGYLVSALTGSAARSSSGRHNPGIIGNGGLISHHVASPVEWMDDGIPVDSSVEALSAAFERTVGEFASASISAAEASSEEPASSGDTSSDVRESNSLPPSFDVGTSNSSDADADEASESNQSTSDGDVMASSLVQGLRLSSGSDNESTSDIAATANPVVLEQVEHVHNVGVSVENALIASTASTSRLEVENTVTSTNAELDESIRLDQSHGRNDSPNVNGLNCPPDVDPEVFNSLPFEMQQDCVLQYNATQDLAIQLDGSSLDPEFLAALPEEMRLEVIDQDRRERQMRTDSISQADPSNAQEMDNASFVASLSPDLREEILLTADDSFLSNLPPDIVAEAQILRERANNNRRRLNEEGGTVHDDEANIDAADPTRLSAAQGVSRTIVSAKRKTRVGKIRAECDRSDIIYRPHTLPPVFGKSDVMLLIRLLYIVSPIRPSRLLQKFIHNLTSNPELRGAYSSVLIYLLHGNLEAARAAVENLGCSYNSSDVWRKKMDDLFTPNAFPPTAMLGATTATPDSDLFHLGLSSSALRRKRKQGQDAAVAIAANFHTNVSVSYSSVPPIVCSRIVETLLQLCKTSPRFCLHVLVDQNKSDFFPTEGSTRFEHLLDLLDLPMFSTSSLYLDQLLSVLEHAVVPLSQIPKFSSEDVEAISTEQETAVTVGREWVDVPRVAVPQARLQSLCSILRNENIRDSSFTKVNNIVRRLCRIESNRGFVLAELAAVAGALGEDAVADLKALKLRLNQCANHHRQQLAMETTPDGSKNVASPSPHLSSSVTLSTSSCELKLLRVLQTLQSLCLENWHDSSNKKSDVSIVVTEELAQLLRKLDFNQLWDELSSCLAFVQVLEGVKELESTGSVQEEEEEEVVVPDEDGEDQNSKKKLRNTAAGLLTRFLPAIEAFFVANGSATRPVDAAGVTLAGKIEDIPFENLVGGQRLLSFVSTNKVLLNALVRNNSSLLEKGFRALVQVPRCRGFLDFDVKQQWFKTQMRRMRQQANRRHGSLRLYIRRKYVFEDAYHQLRLRNADELRGRLHIAFRNEEGVDAGGLSREFFGILSKEIFNRNYALFTSTEDGCTFQPNPNSSINPDHLSYFRFVGRIVGKAVSDGFLLDAHFTRSLYKHMLGIQPSYHDMEAIDPDYYRNLKTILEYNLNDLGLELNFSIEDHSFGRNHTVDLIPNGRMIPVVEDNKEEYTRLVCQHRMTTAIQSQIKSYLDGFYELVPPDSIAIFTPRELELLISGLPDIDVHDLKMSTDYVGWKASDKEIEWFWNILTSLSNNEKASFLQFATGSSKVPLAGFSELQGMRGIQKFSIHKMTGKPGALMSAHTCFNQLDLPIYSSEEEMHAKLLYAINEGGGAFLFA